MIPKFRVFVDEKIREVYAVKWNEDGCFVMIDYGGGLVKTFPVDEVKLMQFTGLLDKDGKEIYEEDIVYCEINNAKAIVKYNNKIGQYRFYFFSGEREDLKRQSKYHGTDMTTWFLSTGSEIPITVIGNTKENPELMDQ